MIKLNLLRWLKILKLALLINSILFLTFSLVVSINFFVAYTTYNVDQRMLMGAYESAVIDGLFVTDFSLRSMYIIIYGILCVAMVCFAIPSIILIKWDQHCLFYSQRLYISNLLVCLGMFIVISILVFSAPAVTSIDLAVSQTEFQPLILCYDFKVENQMVAFRLNQDGLFFLIFLSVLTAGGITIFGFWINRIIRHRYF